MAEAQESRCSACRTSVEMDPEKNLDNSLNQNATTNNAIIQDPLQITNHASLPAERCSHGKKITFTKAISIFINRIKFPSQL